MDRRERAYHLIQEQESWILTHGGNREGYRAQYAYHEKADAIYDADVKALNDLYYDYHMQGGKMNYEERLLEALGDGYFD